MQTDNNLIFVGGTNGNAPLAITTAGTNPSFMLDLSSGLMQNSTTGTYSASTVSGGEFLLSSTLLFGEDLGPGAERLRLASWLSPGTVAGGTNINVQWQGAVDASGGTYPANVSSLTWTVFDETGLIALASLTGGALLPLPDWPDRAIKTAMPRFMRLAFVSTGTFTGLSIAFAGVGLQRPDFNVGQYPGGFQVAP